MKKLPILLMGFLAMFSITSAHAQVAVSVNIGAAPAWAPAGYAPADYYYLPEINAYYDAPRVQFIYVSGGRWVRAARLPVAYRHYDLHRAPKVVIHDYHGMAPYKYCHDHKARYYKEHPGKGKGHHKGKGKGHWKHKG